MSQEGDTRRVEAPGGQLPIGRDRELAELRAALDERRSVVLVGPAGIGKSTLVARAVEGRSAAVGGALGMLAFVPYLALTRAAGPLGAATTTDASAVAAEVAARLGEDGILVLEDLQWADDATLDALERLAGHRAILATVRAGDARADAVLARLLTAGVDELRIEPLEDADAEAIVRRVRPDVGVSAARSIVRAAGGNPFLLEELARAGASSSLRRALAHRVRALPPEAREWLEVLCVAGAPLPVPTDATDPDALVRAGFAVRAGRSIQVRHELIAATVVDDLTAERRAELHRTVAAIADEPAVAVRHLAAAGDRAAAAGLALRAARVAPADLRAALLGLAARCTDGPGGIALRLEAAEALAAVTAWREADDLLESLDDASAELIRTRARWGLGDADGALAAAERGIAATARGAAALHARLLVERAWIVTLRREGDRAVPLARAALRAATDAEIETGPARRTLATARSITGAPMSSWIGHLEGAHRDARDRGDAAEECLCAKIIVASYEGSGDLAVGRRLGEGFCARAHDAGLVGWEQSIRATMVSMANGAGDIARAIDEGLGLLEEPLDRRPRAQVAGHTALALTDAGRLDEAREIIAAGLAGSADDVDGRFDLVWAEAELAAAAGDPGRAVALADAAIARFGEADYGDVRFVRVLRAWARLDLGEVPDPPLDGTRPLHPYLGGTALETVGIGQLAAGRPGDAQRAADTFAAAASAYAGHHRRSELRCRWAEGEARRAAGDLADAIACLTAVEAAAEAHGMRTLLGRVRRSLRLAGTARPAPRTPVADRRPGRGALTVRERDILELVELGLTNLEIARRMGLGRPTVARILSNAMDKLGAESRAQAVVLAAERRERLRSGERIG